MSTNQNNPDSVSPYWLSVSDIKELMEALRKNNLASLKLENAGQSLKLENSSLQQSLTSLSVSQQPEITLTQLTTDLEPSPSATGLLVTSPIVGTFYSSPSPEKAAFVSVGSQVKKGDVLFIIESMKLMNEVLSESDGTITKILVENSQGVEYGQPILWIE